MVDVIKDLGLASILLLLGYGIRSKVKLFQKLYIPAAVIGGVIGLLLGGEVLGKFCPICLHFSSGVGSYANPLLAIVFSSQFLGTRLSKENLRHSGATFFLNASTITMQVSLGLLLTLLFLKGNDLLYKGFGMFPYLGFYGGHGVCASTASVFGDAGLFDTDLGTSAGNTFATIGLLYGVIMGIVLINIFARKGLVSGKAGMQNMTDEDRSGFLRPENRSAAVTALTKNDVLNPVALHFAIIMGIMCLSFAVLPYIQKIPYCGKLNITIPVLFVSIIVNALANKTGLNKYIDHKSLSSITGVALEMLIVTSVANTKLSIFTLFGKEILVLALVILAVDTAFVLFFGKLWHKEHWVENTLGTFGLSTGVLATGFLLIRIADPDNETGAATNLACGNAVSTSTIQMFFNYVFASFFVALGAGFGYGVPLVAFVVFTVLGCVLFAGKKKKA